MSDISRVVMDALRKQLAELEMDAVLISGRVTQLRSTIHWLEHGELPKGRPPKRKSEVGEIALNIVPQCVEGGAHHEPETQETAA